MRAERVRSHGARARETAAELARRLLADLARETRELIGTSVREVDMRDFRGDAARFRELFLREHAGPGLPLAMRGACARWRAARLWREDAYLSEKMRGTPRVTVSFSPSGRADAVCAAPDASGSRSFFCEPLQVSMGLAAALSRIGEGDRRAAVQAQQRETSRNL